MSEAYRQFLARKVCVAESLGFEVDPAKINPGLSPHARAIVPWLCRGGRRALFASFGLQKTVMQLEAVRLAAEHGNGPGLITIPLGVRQEFRRDAVQRLGWSEPPAFIRSADNLEPGRVYLTNYETVRDGKLDPQKFVASSLDEADVLRGFGGSKTFREFMALFAGDRKTMDERTITDGVRYRFVATATPSPNDHIELLAYAAYLGIMDVSAAKTRFFKRNSEKADELTIHPHKEREFWLWVSTWALIVTKPSDLGPEFSDEGYVLPKLDLRWHEIPTDHAEAGHEKDGQARMFSNAAVGVSDAAREKRRSLDARIEKMLEIRAEEPDEHRIIWHDLEDERRAIEAAVPGVRSVYGSQDLDEREATIIDFSDGKFAELAAKPTIAGAGCNFQRHCARSIFIGIGWKFRDLIQAIHRTQRFLQTREVRVDMIYTEAERDVRRGLEEKWAKHVELQAQLTAIVREYGLANANAAAELTRAMGVPRIEVKGEKFRAINNDCVLEAETMADDSVGLILTSVPFSTQYEYSPNYSDFGHTDNNAHFFEQMDFLTPHLLRVLQPGRLAVIHVKDRIVPGGLKGLGFQTVYRFSDKTVDHFEKHGFEFISRKTIVTDVVRENNQTYRLGWTEQCKDGTKMGNGLPEYLLVLRKKPTDNSRSYADVPVVKDKATYTRARWQFDAHGFARSSGDRRLMPEELDGLEQNVIFKLFKKHSLENVYDFEHDVKIAEHVAARGWLPSSFMLLQPQSWHPDVWTDITRMRTLNGIQSAKGKEMHLCPMQFDIADRVIAQLSNPGDVVFDPFAGLFTVPERAIRLGRIGVGTELATNYFLDGVAYCQAAEREVSMPSLFDLDEMQMEQSA